MRALNFVDCAVRVDERGTWLNLLLDKPYIPLARQFVLKRKDRLYTAELKEFRERRSLDANSYYWKLCGDLARSINEKPEEIYLRHIKDIGYIKGFYPDWTPESVTYHKQDHLNEQKEEDGNG